MVLELEPRLRLYLQHECGQRLKHKFERQNDEPARHAAAADAVSARVHPVALRRTRPALHAAHFALTLCSHKDKDAGLSQKDISTVALLYILSAFNLARHLNRRMTLRLPSKWRARIEDALRIRTKPFSDSPHLASLIRPRCRHTLVACMASFQALPLVEFKIINGLIHDEAVKLIRHQPPRKHKRMHAVHGEKEEEKEDEKEEEAGMLHVDENEGEFDAKVETATAFLESKQVLLRRLLVAALRVRFALAASARLYGDEARLASCSSATFCRSTIKVA